MSLQRFSKAGLVAALVSLMVTSEVLAQKAWFADGYHGGVYGHYPPSFTQFIVDSLQQHPGWKLNLEIEPETWDFVRTNTPEAYQAFLTLAADQTANGRIEFVNPAYGQSYLWNISGESVIQQLTRGIAKVREHFPNAQFKTYCSEEPCFTSALPGILRSLGFQEAVLKNPDTCWGGYTRAFGGELVNWIGPDGTAIRTVPRYAIESLKPGSTWQTIAFDDSPTYLNAALQSGIENPIGMCLQDAGWRNGPWLHERQWLSKPIAFTTWRNYFENVASQKPAHDWNVNQEDIQVSLVWGAQVLQRVAQQVRSAENRIVMAEKMATLANVLKKTAWPGEQLDEAWRTLMLSQHHDCWIVPYNGRPHNTWADKVADWTSGTCAAANEIINRSATALASEGSNHTALAIRVFNTIAAERSGLISIALPGTWSNAPAKVLDIDGREIPSQPAGDEPGSLVFRASAPSLGFNTYRIQKGSASKQNTGASVTRQPSGLVRLDTDLYRIELDPSNGGTIQSLLAKKLRNRELVASNSERRFNELRGYFFDQKRFFSTADTPAKIDIMESGPVRIRLQITGQLASNSVTQWITLAQGEPRIDFRVKIDWQGKPHIGADPEQFGRFRNEEDRRAFYDDRFKLLALFPANFQQQQVFKDAPFDVTASTLTNTLFDAWSEIKNNIILRWVDLYDPQSQIGLALMTDHTTSYAHGSDFPLALTLQYAGVGLWGRDYSVQGPTEVSYSLLPHREDHEHANVWAAGESWNEPLVARVVDGVPERSSAKFSLLTIEGAEWEVPTIRCRPDKVLIRLFNPSSDAGTKTVHYRGTASKVELVQLNGDVIRELPMRNSSDGYVNFELALSKFAVGTLRITP